MLTVYLAALIFGFGVLAVQLLFSSDAGHEVTDGAAGHELVEAQAGAHAEWASIFTSLRFYMFAAIAFGMVGAPMSWLRPEAPGLTLLVALGTAALVGLGAALGFRSLGRQPLSSGVAAPELVGQLGRVLIACERARRGKVRLKVRGQIIDFIATTDDARLEPGTAVIVQEVHGERLLVCAAPIELLPE